jgi:precorrin-6B methylase 1
VPLEEMRKNKRLMDRAARKIERERTKIENQEKKHMQEITKLAKAGQHVSVLFMSQPPLIESSKDPF